MTVIGIFGSRNGAPDHIIKKVINVLTQKHGNITIVVGDCIGVDQQVYNYCTNNNIPVGVITVHNNWSKISYKPAPEHIIKTIGTNIKSLKARLHQRTVELVKYVKQHNGYLVGINTSGKGSQLAIRTAQQLNVPVKLVNPKNS